MYYFKEFYFELFYRVKILYGYVSNNFYSIFVSLDIYEWGGGILGELWL